MLKRTAGFFLGLSLWGGAVVEVQAQKPPAAVVSGVEPGLEEAVKWKWRVVPSPEKDWGLELPELPPPPVSPPPPVFFGVIFWSRRSALPPPPPGGVFWRFFWSFEAPTEAFVCF